MYHLNSIWCVDDVLYAVPFRREGIIPPNWTDTVQIISQRVALYNIYLEDTWFTPDLEEYPIETPRHELGVAPENNNKKCRVAVVQTKRT